MKILATICFVLSTCAIAVAVETRSASTSSTTLRGSLTTREEESIPSILSSHAEESESSLIVEDDGLITRSLIGDRGINADQYPGDFYSQNSGDNAKYSKSDGGLPMKKQGKLAKKGSKIGKDAKPYNKYNDTKIGKKDAKPSNKYNDKKSYKDKKESNSQLSAFLLHTIWRRYRH